MNTSDQAERRAGYVFILIFTLMTIERTLIVPGVVEFRRYRTVASPSNQSE